MDSAGKNHTVLNTQELSIGYLEGSRRRITLHEKINISLEQGDLICLAGPNGCGKSTLLRTLAGLQPALAGEIFFDKRKLSQMTTAEISTLMSVVLTEQTIIDTITVREICAIGRYHMTNWLGKIKDEDQRIINEALQLVGMQHLAERHFGTLSDGEKQRAFIAKALSAKTPLLLLDEPTAHLDIPNRVEVMELLRALTRKDFRTILISTHDLDLALQLADEIWLMHPEKPLIAATPEEISDSGLIDQYFGSSSFRFVPRTGSFKVQRAIEDKIGITGSGERFDQLIRALGRLGLEAIENKEQALSVSVDRDHYNFHSQTGSETITDLKVLLKKIRSSKP